MLLEKIMKTLLQKIFVLTPDGWSTRPFERKTYYSYFFGQNAIYNLINSFLTTYLLLVGINPLKSATVMMIVKVWDAVNDCFFGVIFDKVHFKSGQKFVPWIRVSSFLTPIATVAMFIIPSSMGENAKLAWFALSYIVWDTVYTISDAPIHGIITALTNNIDERNSMMSYKSIWTGAGSGFCGLVVPIFISSTVGLNYGISAAVICALSLITMVPAAFTMKERYEGRDEETFTLRRMFSYLFKNKYLLIYYLGFFMWSSLGIAGTLNLFVSYYLFDNELFLTLIGFLGTIPTLIMSVAVPRILKKIDKMDFYKLNVLAIIVLTVIMYLIGYKNIWAFLVLYAIRTVPYAAMGTIMFFFTPDCAEYGFFVSGVDAKGITFSIQTFMCKLTGAISGSLSLFLLGLKSVGFKNYEATNFAELNALGAVQTPHAMNALWFLYMIVPMIGGVLSLIVWNFYKLRDKDVEVMIDCNTGKITKEEANTRLTENKLNRKRKKGE